MDISYPIYNHIFKAVQSGQMQIDPMTIKPLLDRVEKIPDNEYISMFMPFSLSCFSTIGIR